MNIIVVQKIKRDGQPCAKSAKVLGDLNSRGLLPQIHRIVAADEGDPDSEGYELAAQFQVEAAPFFLVERDGGDIQVYEAYARFLKEVFQQEPSEAEEIAEMMAQNPDLDFI
ncbi:MAG: hypothetical protein HC890_14350 [Chloroflexaceae bacterium]|nr:hypothetical protein [Chloroflexaceae bacterium]